MIDTDFPTPSSAGPQPTADSAAAPYSPAQGAAAVIPKARKKTCEFCGAIFQSTVSKSGNIEASTRFAKRRYCGLSCSGKANYLARQA